MTTNYSVLFVYGEKVQYLDAPFGDQIKVGLKLDVWTLVSLDICLQMANRQYLTQEHSTESEYQ